MLAAGEDRYGSPPNGPQGCAEPGSRRSQRALSAAQLVPQRVSAAWRVRRGSSGSQDRGGAKKARDINLTDKKVGDGVAERFPSPTSWLTGQWGAVCVPFT